MFTAAFVYPPAAVSLPGVESAACALLDAESAAWALLDGVRS